MKKQQLIIGILVFGVALLLCFSRFHKRIISSIDATTQTNQNLKSGLQAKSQGEVSQTIPRSSAGSKNIEARISSAPITVQEYVQNKLADPKYDWKQPINFYGKVIDEKGQAVEGSSAHFKWTDLSDNGTSEADARTDNNGLFSLTDRTGKRMSITVSKDGYYTPPSEKLSSFEYANPADGLFSPDSRNPVIFHLRKKGIGADLITSQNGLKTYFGVNVPNDGKPVRVDMLGQKGGGQEGQMVLSQIKPTYESWKQAASWSFRMEIPSGGFIQQSDEFPFQAPESGYQPVIQFDFQKEQTNWTTAIKNDYYIRFGNPPVYGRLHLDTSIVMSGARLTYAINPDGSRNLEPK